MERERIVAKLANLESEGRLFVKNFGNQQDQPAWELSCKNILEVCFPTNSLFVRAFDEAGQFSHKVEVIASAAREFREGFTLEDIRLPYLRVVYTDIANEAQALLDEGFLRCGAVVARVALERHLRELARLQGVVDADGKKPGILNQELWKSGAYTKGTWTEIDSWLALGNEAAHAVDFESKYDAAQVQRTITSIQAFVKTP